LVRRLLRLSLEMKLLIPNAAVIAIAIIAFVSGMGEGAAAPEIQYLVTSVLVAGAALNFVLVRLALRPVNEMRLVAEQVANGNLRARVQPSLIADPGLAQLGATFNSTIEYLSESRERMRESGARIVYAQERERSNVARELHDSIGQTLAAASYQAAAAAKSTEGTQNSDNALEVARLLRLAIDDLRSMSRELHPRVADDLGLPAALESLARATMDRSLLDVQVSVKAFREEISSAASSTFYRIAQQALRSIEATASCGNVQVSLSSPNNVLQLEISDDCSYGVNASSAGLGAMAERIAILGGELVVESNFVGGTRVIARLRRQQEAA
jgi:signal transduction histidine kinase